MLKKALIKIINVVILFIIIPTYISCEKDDEGIEESKTEPEFLYVQPVSLSFGSDDAEPQLFSVDTNDHYTVNSNLSWIKLRQSGNYWSVSVSPNLENESREGEIIVSNNNSRIVISVTQDKYTPHLMVSTETITFYNELVNSFSIRSNEDWIVQKVVNHSWLHFSLSQNTFATVDLIEGSGDSKIRVIIDESARLPVGLMNKGYISITGKKSGIEKRIAILVTSSSY